MARIGIYISHHPPLNGKIIANQLTPILANDIFFIFIEYKKSTFRLFTTTSNSEIPLFLHVLNKPQPLEKFLKVCDEICSKFTERLIYMDSNLGAEASETVEEIIVPIVNRTRPYILGLFTRTSRCIEDANNLLLDNLVTNKLVFEYYPPFIDLIDIEKEMILQPSANPITTHIEKYCSSQAPQPLPSLLPAISTNAIEPSDSTFTETTYNALPHQSLFHAKESRSPDLEELAAQTFGQKY